MKKDIEPAFKSFYDPTWNPKDDDDTKDVDDNQFPGHVNESQVETDIRDHIEFKYDSDGKNTISRSEDPPQTATELA